MISTPLNHQNRFYTFIIHYSPSIILSPKKINQNIFQKNKNDGVNFPYFCTSKKTTAKIPFVSNLWVCQEKRVVGEQVF